MSPSSAALSALLVAVAACTAAEPVEDSPPTTTSATSETETPIDGDPATVLRVEDGDSIVVEIGGREERVRLIGINAPEQGECLADAAGASLAALLEGHDVVLEPDVVDRDDFGRLLRYVYVGDTFANAAQVQAGLAISRSFEPNTARQPRLDRAQEQAETESSGMWSADACGRSSDIRIAILAIQSDPPGPDEDDLNGEFVIFENRTSEPAALGGFVLRDASSRNRYSFPAGFVVPGDGRFVVYVGCGDDTVTELYWCSDKPVWSNGGDEVFLTDASGGIIAHDSY